MKMETDLCFAIGCDLRNMEVMDIYLTAGRIIRDQVLADKARALFPECSRLKAIEAMTPAERRDLRERICGVLPFPKQNK